jgi:hypothetical protein
MAGIPGANVLKMAFRLLTHEDITYYQYQDRTQNNVGQDVTEYAPPVIIRGSFQPVPRRMYAQYGLDFQKEYYTFYTSNNLLDIQRDVSGDQIWFQGVRYQCESSNEWFGIDGWVAILCVAIANIAINQPIFGFNAYNPSFPTLENTYVNFGNGNFSEGANP